jgi:glycosyltransferase involved in cell wall biosynthesis
VTATRSTHRGRPLTVLAILPQLIPSTLIGVVKPLLALHRERHVVLDVALESWVSGRRLARADVIVFCRNTEPHYGAPLEAALRLGKPIVYELDDDFFAMPSSAPGSSYHRDAARLAQLERYLRTASLVRVYSEALRTRVAALNPHVYRVAALVDWDLVPPAPPARDPAVLRIVYATSRIVDPLAAMFMPDLRRVLDTFHGRVGAWFWGFHPADLAGRRDVHFVDFVQDYDAFFRGFASAGFDIGIAPLPDDEFYRAKSDNKFREYAAGRIAGVYSDVLVYQECVAHGRTGLLVPAAPDAWFNAVARLIEDDALRTAIQDQAWACARERYSVEQSKHVWLDHLEGAIAHGRPVGALVGAVGRWGPGRSRTLGLIRRGAEALQRRQTPGAFALGARVRWHLRSVRALVQLRRELARSRSIEG